MTEASAVCRWCGQPKDGRSCTGETVEIVKVSGGVAPPGVYPRVPYPPAGEGWPQRCRDCHTPQGGLHHPGCDVERCPVPECRDLEGHQMQAISCGCRWAGDPEDEEADEDEVLTSVAVKALSAERDRLSAEVTRLTEERNTAYLAKQNMVMGVKSSWPL